MTRLYSPSIASSFFYIAMVLFCNVSLTKIAKSDELLKKYADVNGWTVFEVYGGSHSGECRLYKEVNRRFSVVLYADANDRFGIGVFDREELLFKKSTLSAAVRFDYGQWQQTTLSIRKPSLAFFRLGFEENSPGDDFRRSNRMFVQLDNQDIAISLAGSNNATDKLWDCVSNTPHQVYTSSSNEDYLLQCNPNELLLSKIPDSIKAKEANLITLKPNCVAESNYAGYGKWSWGNAGFAAEFLNANVRFPHAEILCKDFEPPQFGDQCGPFAEIDSKNPQVFVNQNGVWVSGINKPILSVSKQIDYSELVDQLPGFDIYGPDQLEARDTVSVISEEEVVFLILADGHKLQRLRIASADVVHTFDVQIGGQLNKFWQKAICVQQEIDFSLWCNLPNSKMNVRIAHKERAGVISQPREGEIEIPDDFIVDLIEVIFSQ